MNTPWGKSDTAHTLVPGVVWVSTPSHGGLMVSKKAAEGGLSAAARAAGELYGSHYCYDEDCKYAIVFFECPGWFRADDVRSLASWREPFKSTFAPRLAARQIARLERRLSAPDDEAYRAEALEVVAVWDRGYLTMNGYRVVMECVNCHATHPGYLRGSGRGWDRDACTDNPMFEVDEEELAAICKIHLPKVTLHALLVAAV